MSHDNNTDMNFLRLTGEDPRAGSWPVAAIPAVIAP
jgi:hypothetical protein